MVQNDALLEPLEGYEKLYKDLHLKNTEALFDELTRKGRVDVAANKATVTQYDKKLGELEKVKKAISRSKGLKIFLIVLSVIALLAGVIALVSAIVGGRVLWPSILALVGAVALTVLFTVLICVKINPKIKQNEQTREILQTEADLLLNEAWTQMAGLNSLYDWNIPQSLVTKTVPVIQMDDNFDEERFTYLHERYGLEKNTDATRSTQFCQSGEILGNPFLILKDLKQSWVNQRYDGALTIHWTTTVRTKEGTKTVHHTQVLYACVHKPKPVYDYDTYLVYGNEAAPNLTFSRTPSGASGLDEKQIDKKVKAKAKKLDKKARKAIASGDDYTRLGNDEFEALFGGTDRDNEVEYRMLFTPLAQKNLLKLIKTPQPYGDDFAIRKIKKLNYLRSEHAQGFDYEVDPVRFVGYDYESARANFISVNTEYFKSLYFDLAPLISIPLYQQTKTREFIYDKKFASNVSCYEHESIANSFKKELLKPEHAATPSILKTQLISKQDSADEVLITAYAYRGERRITYVPQFGGDGRMHAVPVVWIEYFPIERRTQMAVQKKRSSRPDFNAGAARAEFKDMLKSYSDRGAYLYERGVFAMLTDRRLTADAVRRMGETYGDADNSDAGELAKMIFEEAAMHDRSNVPDEDADALLQDENAETLEVAADEVAAAIEED